MVHQLGIGKATIGQKHHLAGARKPLRGLVQQCLVDLIGHRGTAMLQHRPHQGDGSPPVDHRQANDAIGIPQHRGIQGHIEPLAKPAHHGLLHERTIECVHVDLVVVEPASKAAYRALTIRSATDHKRAPGAQADRVGVDQAHHHPGQGFEMAKVEPIGMLAQHSNQRIIEVRRVLHEFSPRKNRCVQGVEEAS